MRLLTVFLAAALLLAGCSDSGESSAPAVDKQARTESPASTNSGETAKASTPAADDPWHVVESFEVGRDVYVRSLALEPKANSLWVGTSVGVHEVDLATQELRNTFTRAEGLANEYVFAIFVDRDGYKWFGTNGGGMARYKDGDWRVFFPFHGLADYWVYSFGQQADGGLWVGTWAGVNHWDPKTEKMSTYFDELINEWVYGIAVDSLDHVWFATEGGMSMFDGQEWHSWTGKDGLGAPNQDNLPISFNTGLGTRSRHDLSLMAEGEPTYNPNYLFCVLADKKDHIWAGTWGGGVTRYDGQRWINYTTADGLAGNVVYSIAEAEDGTLWFGTDHGVSRYDGKSWHSYGHKDGLLSEHVYAVAVTPAGEVWVGTRGGVTRLAQSDENKQAGDTK